MLSNAFTHRNIVSISLTQFPHTNWRAHGKMSLSISLPPLFLPRLNHTLALVPGNITKSEVGCNQLDLSSSPFAEPSPLSRHLNPTLRMWVTFSSWAGEISPTLVHLCYPVLQKGSTMHLSEMQAFTASHQSLLPTNTEGPGAEKKLLDIK